MEKLLAKIAAYKNEISGSIVSNREQLEAFRIKFLGTKGLVKTIMSEMKDVAVDKKKEAGQLLNEFKSFTETFFENLQQSIENGQGKADHASGIDVSLPGTGITPGGRHPISIIQNKIISIFHRLGFSVAEGPEIEDD